MKALVLEGLHQPLAIKEVPTPSLQPGEVLVQVKPLITGTYGFRKASMEVLNIRLFWVQMGQGWWWRRTVKPKNIG